MTYQIAGINFPDEAQGTLVSWKRRSDYIQTATASPMPSTCRNCNGGGFVYLRLLLGNFSFSPSTKKAITWLDGYWRIIEERAGFICPDCKGKGRPPFGKVVHKPTQEALGGLVEKLDHTPNYSDDYTNI